MSKLYWDTGDDVGNEIGPETRKWIMEDQARRAAEQQAKSASLPGGMSSDQATEAAYRKLAQDRAALGGTNYPAYRGETTAPMSTLTQRAQELRNRYAQKAAPYSKKLETVQNRGNQGLTPENIQELLSKLREQHREFAVTPMQNILKKQFLSSYTPRESQYIGKSEKDIGRLLPETQARLQDIGKVAGQLEGSRNREGAKILQYMQAEKQARRQGTIGALEQFGKQKHAYTNILNQANRGQFRQEANEPYDKMQMLESSLAPHGASYEQEIHPDLTASKAHDIARAMQAYNTKLAPYPGQLVANLPAEIQQSHSMLERLNPSLQDSYTDKRKELTRGFVGSETPSQRALQNLFPAMQGEVGLLERQAQDRMKKDLEALNNKYVRLGQYGSPQHIGEAERRTREINKGVLEARNKMLQDTLGKQLQLQYGSEIGNLKQLGQIGRQSHTDYGDILKNLSDLNTTGATKFANDQAENEDVYRNYQNEKAWRWPHMRGTAQGGGVDNNNFAPIVPNSNLALENLHNLNTSFSNIDREGGRVPVDINSMNRFHAMNAALPAQAPAYNQQAQQGQPAQPNLLNPAAQRSMDWQNQNTAALNQSSEQQGQALRQRYNLPQAQVQAQTQAPGVNTNQGMPPQQYGRPRGFNAGVSNQVAGQSSQAQQAPFNPNAANNREQMYNKLIQLNHPSAKQYAPYKNGGSVYR